MSTSFNDRVEAFCARLADRRVESSLAAAKGTAELLRQLVTSSRLHTPEVMLAEVKRVGLRLQSAKPIGAHCSICCKLVLAALLLLSFAPPPCVCVFVASLYVCKRDGRRASRMGQRTGARCAASTAVDACSTPALAPLYAPAQQSW